MTSESQSAAEVIGTTAGEVWTVLSASGDISLAKLAKQINVPRDQVMQAIGWLAREGKIEIDGEKRVKTIRLVAGEKTQAA